MVLDMHTTDAQLVRAALAMLRGQTPGAEALTDGELLALALQRTLHDAHDSQAPTAEPYRVLLKLCPNCGDVCGVDHEVDETIAGEAVDNHDTIDLRPGPDQGSRSRSIPPKVRRTALYAFGGGCAVPGCTNRLWIHLHHPERYGNGGEHTPDNLLPLCSSHHRMDHNGDMASSIVDGHARFEFLDGTVRTRPMPHMGHTPLPAQRRQAQTDNSVHRCPS